ncbi:MAG: DEAD/DEAH box helicase [Deltaproteobacteria bacterium]|nr:DEAD/DEAH box helicase [Deltaproteobacteria bacterium]
MSAVSPSDESANAEANPIVPPPASEEAMTHDDDAFKASEDAQEESVEEEAVEEEAVEEEAVEEEAVEEEAVEASGAEEEAAAAKKAAKKAKKAAKKAAADEEAQEASDAGADGEEEAEQASEEEAVEEDTGPKFTDFPLDKRILKNLAGMGFEKPTPIQSASMEPLLAGGDIIGRARTGSGKTAAYGLPLIQSVVDGAKTPRSIVLCPTRELAQQTALVLQKFSKGIKNVEVVTLFGGVAFVPQLRQLQRGASIVVGTPGRLLDHLRRGNLAMADIETIVLDEADEMLRMGFIDDVIELLDATPPERQVALFSATMPPVIERIAKKHCRNPITIQVESKGMSVDHIEQRYCFVPPARKMDALMRFMLAENWGTTLLFCRTRRGCAEVTQGLIERGLSAAAIHSDLDMAARGRALQDLDKGRIQVLVATDVAARGIDVQGIGRVVNYDFPDEIESYVHRIGRTGRAGREGHALTFVTPGERYRLQKLRHVIKVDPDQATVPSDSQLQQLHLDKIIKDIGGFIGRKSVEALQELTEQLLGESFPEVSQADLLATTLALLCKERDVFIEMSPDTSPPFWAKREDRSRGRGQNGPVQGGQGAPGRSSNRGETEVVLSAGRNSGLRPADIVGSLLAQTDVPKESIGRITMQNHQCFVWVAEDVAASLVNNAKSLNIRGDDIGVNWAKQGGGSSAGGGGGGGGAPRRGRRGFDKGGAGDRFAKDNRSFRRDREDPPAKRTGAKRPTGNAVASKKQADSIKVKFKKPDAPMPEAHKPDAHKASAAAEVKAAPKVSKPSESSKRPPAEQKSTEKATGAKPFSAKKKAPADKKSAKKNPSGKKKKKAAGEKKKKAAGEKKKKAAGEKKYSSGKKFAATRVDDKKAKPKKKPHRGQG